MAPNRPRKPEPGSPWSMPDCQNRLTQIVVRDDFGEFVARIDMGYREFKVGIEYDGEQLGAIRPNGPRTSSGWHG